ncbi:MAG TPA: hypothetical protein VEP90_07500 [Methylomirabilota bacterium]|nr:hypothetical protein [Methylomirabilota bacterium]
MSNETQPGKHTLSGDGEPAQSELTKFKATVVIDGQGNPGLVLQTEQFTFLIHGEDLFNFYAMLKRFLEGEAKGKRPSYLG